MFENSLLDSNCSTKDLLLSSFILLSSPKDNPIPDAPIPTVTYTLSVTATPAILSSSGLQKK